MSWQRCFRNGMMQNIFGSFSWRIRMIFRSFSILSEAVEDTIDDAEQLERLILEMPYTENLDELFHPLGSTDLVIRELTREKARNWNRIGHASWLRVYAIRVEKNVFVITGGAIKLTHAMQDRAHTQKELGKLNQCRQYLLDNGVFDSDSFISMIEEDNV